MTSTPALAVARPHLHPQPRGWAFGLTALALATLVAGTELPTPLYVVYQRRFGFGDTVLTVIFAVYALVLIPALLVGGRVADRRGRAPVIVAGLVLGVVAAGLLAIANGTPGLLAGRALQGVAVGLTTGPATAALVELRGGPDRRAASVWTTVAVAGGGCAGPLIAGLLGQYAPAPLQLSYLLQGALLVLLAVALVAVRGSFRRSSPRGRTGPGRVPAVPRGLRRPFAQVGLTVFAAWSVGGLFTALVPSYAAQLVGTRNLAALGAVPFAMLAVATLTQLVARAVPARPARVAGLLTATAGIAAMVAAFPTRSVLLLALSAVLCGIGLGLAFLGAQSELQELAPAERRAEVSAAFTVCLYLGVSVPVIGAGLVADATSLFAGVAAFGALLAALAAAGVAGVVRG